MELRSHPALARAVAEFASWLVDSYTGGAIRNLLLSDRGRMLLGFFVLYLDALPLPGTSERGATLGGVQALCRSTGICSAGRAASMVAMMRLCGQVTQVADINDRRRRLLVPTSVLVSAFEQNWRRQFQAMAHVFPEVGSVPALLDRPAFRVGFLRALGEAFLAGFRVLDHVPVLEMLTERNAALMVLTSLALGQIAGEGDPEEVVPITVSAISRRFKISRAHVRSILEIAEGAALIASRPEMGGVLVRPALRESLLQVYGVMFILYRRSALTAEYSNQ